MPRRLLIVLLAASALGGCEVAPADESPAPARGQVPGPAPEPTVEEATCPPDAANCAAVTGRVLYVEAVDPDGDGDAHYVLIGGGVTAPGITVVDVRAGLRPARLPQRGERVSAAGPVYTGSFGQRQIEATEVRHER